VHAAAVSPRNPALLKAGGGGLDWNPARRLARQPAHLAPERVEIVGGRRSVCPPWLAQGA
jgi:hypothetical protein